MREGLENKSLWASQEVQIRTFLHHAEKLSISDLLKELGQLFEADRVYIYENDQAKEISVNTYEWVAPNAISQKEIVRSAPLEEVLFINDLLEDGEYVLNSIEDLDHEDRLYEVFSMTQIESIILTPLMIDGEIAGYIGINNPKKNRDMSLLLTVVSSVICSKILIHRSLANNDESFLVLSKLREQYVSMYFADLQTDYMHTYKTSSDYKDKYGITTLYSDSMGGYVKNDIAKKDRERMIAATNPKNVMKRFEEEDSFVLDFEDASIAGETHYCQLVYIRANKAGTQAVICGKDCTKEKKEEIRRGEELEEMQEILRSADMGTWHIELIEGQAPRMLADERMMELLGLPGEELTPEEIYDKWYSNIVPADEASVLYSVSQMESGKRDENTYRWIHPTLGERYVRCGGTAKEVPGGYVLRGYHYDVDDIIHEQEKQAKMIKDALDYAEKANQLKTDFLNNMSHDIRTPMNAIIGYASLASIHMDDREQVEDYLAKIKVSGDHLLSLINDVLDMSRIESGKVVLDEKPNHLPDVFKNIETITQANAYIKHQNFTVDMVDVIHKDVICDEVRLTQVLLNILNNATKFTKEKGAICFTIEEKPSEIKGKAHFSFKVQDNGIGMNEEFISHIFEPFAREQTSTVTRIQGTGLGMSICKNIVDMMGGEISVESQEDVGSTFYVELDFTICDEKIESEPSLEEEMIVDGLNGKRILLVEDNELNREIAVEILSMNGMCVKTACDGDEAVALMQIAQPKDYDLILMDIQMPRMNGYEATKAIRKLNHPGVSDLPILAMTANAFDEDRELADEAGMDGYIAKPIDIAKMLEIVGSFLKK